MKHYTHEYAHTIVHLISPQNVYPCMIDDFWRIIEHLHSDPDGLYVIIAGELD